ncbi:hypothetical protein KHA93_11670 [Bacillus sp. FJAT-49732]|uniref:Uncharacterized protein n=1 Tax=Lederbergia citrisecunda TaxID=2833583 RepID=A0A942TQA1_9BACI|nr:hypothetical protein [Lederbergia citrisecunda]MBS4200289.1 hypothetical protein [Lederbergia citrisecunda]
MTTICIALLGLVLLGLMFVTSHLWDRVDKLQEQVNQQEFNIGYDKMAIKQLAEDVHKDKG